MNLVPIGNSKGVRLSKNLIDKYELSNGFEIIELDDGLKLLPKKKNLRCGWDEIFKKIAEEEKLDDDFLNLDIDLVHE
jgi:antitoxin MazE